MAEFTPETIIASDTLIRGEIVLQRAARILGRVEGHVAAQDGLEIGASATIVGDIAGTSVAIHGTVRGNVTATTVVRIGATGRVVGDVRAAALAVAEGAMIVGKMAVGEVGGQTPSVATPAESAGGVELVPPPGAAVAIPLPVATITVSESVSVSPQAVAGGAAEAEPTIRVVSQTLEQAQASGNSLTPTIRSKVIKAR